LDLSYGIKVGIKNRVPGLPDGENRVILWSLVLTYQRVTDRRTDMPPIAITLCIAERQKIARFCDTRWAN